MVDWWKVEASSRGAGTLTATDADQAPLYVEVPTRTYRVRARVRSVVWLAAVAAALALAGCGSALRNHAAAATIARAALDTGSAAVMDARAAELDACETAPEPVACLDAGEARWQPWVASLRLVVEAWETWRDAVISGFRLPDEGVAAAICAVALRHLLTIWTALADVLASAGVEMPRSPAEVLALIGGAS